MGYVEDMKNNLQILYEDNHIIVVIKPFNVLSQSDNTNDLDTSIDTIDTSNKWARTKNQF